MTPGVEDLLRSAVGQKAAEIGPDSIPPLDVAALATRGGARKWPLRPARFARWPRSTVVPLAAAVAVVAVVALSIALPRMLTGHGPAAGYRPPASPSGTGQAGAIPPYYVALASASSQPSVHPLGITVRSTMTGGLLATVKPPAPYGTFTLVAHGPDDDTFIVGAQRWRSPGDDSSTVVDGGAVDVRLMLLHFNPSTRSVSFSPLAAVPSLDAADLQSVALSPDGSELAVAVQPSPTLLDLDVYSLTGGGVRTWSLRGTAAGQWSVDRPATNNAENASNPNAMSWLPDGDTLAFDLTKASPPHAIVGTVRELDVDRPGGDLLADSRQIFALNPNTAPLDCVDPLQLSADAASVTCAGYETESYSAAASGQTKAKAGATPKATTVGPPQDTFGFGVYSVATGRLTTVLDPTPLGDPLLVTPQLFWQGGGSLIGTLSGPVIILTGSQQHVTPWDMEIVAPPGTAVAVAW